MYLEKNVSGRWMTNTSCKIEGTGSVFISKTRNGVSNTEYRVRVVVTVAGEQTDVVSTNSIWL